MIQAQKKRVSLVERLLGATTPELAWISSNRRLSVDAEFFSTLNRLMEGADASGQEQYIAQMDAIQKQLLEETEYGRKISEQANEVQEALKLCKRSEKTLTVKNCWISWLKSQ